MGMGPIGTNLPVWSLINVIQALFVLNSKDKNCWKRKSWFCFCFFSPERKECEKSFGGRIGMKPFLSSWLSHFVLVVIMSLEERHLIVGCCRCAMQSICGVLSDPEAKMLSVPGALREGLQTLRSSIARSFVH